MKVASGSVRWFLICVNGNIGLAFSALLIWSRLFLVGVDPTYSTLKSTSILQKRNKKTKKNQQELMKQTRKQNKTNKHEM